MAVTTFKNPNGFMRVSCTCGRGLFVKQADQDHYNNTQYVLVGGHKCQDMEPELLAKLNKLTAEIGAYETKLRNFKEFGKLMKGIE